MKLISFVLLIILFSFSHQQDCPLSRPVKTVVNGFVSCDLCDGVLDPYSDPPECVAQTACPISAPLVDLETGWCTPCPDNTPWWSFQNGEYACRACPLGYSYNTFSRMCVNACPEGTVTNANGICVLDGLPPRCPSPGLPYYIPSNNTCVSLCPIFTENVEGNCTACPPERPKWNDTEDRQISDVACLAECPLNKPDYRTETNICKFCDNDFPYWDNTSLSCVSECPSKTPSNTSDLWCATCLTATLFPFWDPVDRTCMKICPPTRPRWDDDYTCSECPDEFPYWSDTSKTCVDKCPDLSPSWNEDKWCQPCPPDKPYWNTTNKVCEVCSLEQPYWNNITRTCIEKCYVSAPTTPDFNANKWCQACNNSHPYWNNIIHQCTDLCPDEAPYINESENNWCQACTDPKPVWINSLSKCNETCPIDKPDTNDIGWCVPCDPTTPFYNSTTEQCEACPDSVPYYDSDTRDCGKSCPLLKPDTDANNWCKSCGTNIYWDNFTDPHVCTSNCPSAAPLKNISILWCQACSDLTPYYDKINNKCVSICAPPLPMIVTDNWCEACPTETPYWDSTLITPGCVVNCSASVPFVDSRNVCIACPNNTPYWDIIDKVCVDTCPIPIPYPNPTNKTCQACQGSTKWNYFSSTCVETCPVSIPKTDSNNWCSACTDPTSKWDPNYNGGDCVSGCPVSTPDSDAFNWCHACPNDKPRWDSSVSPGRCTSSCPVSLPKTGQNDWCEACPSSQHWSPITSSCTQSCIIPKPYINSDNWCDVCPSAKPFWDAALPECVSNCPHRTPSVDVNNQCQSCPSDKPNWDPDASKCVITCPPLKPFVGMDNWCEPCPNPTPYWFSGNNTCVEICPPVAPAVDNINWCRECVGATLKWNPLLSACVSECPESLPFWNANAIPRACEAGPDIGNVVEYLDTAGIVSTVALAGMQISMPGIPYVGLSILLINILKYIRYLEINYPPEPMKMFQRSSLNIPSLNFGPLFPEAWKIATYSHPAPERFARYDISGLFIANFWRAFTTALIIAFGIGILKIILKKNIANKEVAKLRDTIKVFLIWNYAFSFFTSNIGNIVLFILVEYRSLYLHDVIGTLSFLLTLILSQISLVVVILMIKLIKKADKANKQVVKEQIVPPINESFKVLLMKYKHDNLSQMLFIPIICIRAVINAIIVAALDNPIVQCSLLVAVNIIMLGYYVKTRPHRELVDNVQVLAFEITLLVADSICLYLSFLPWEEQAKAESAGFAIIVCNTIMFTLSIIFVLTRVIIGAIRIFKEKLTPKRPSATVSVQTDITRTEADISTIQTSQKKNAKGNRFLTLSFESSAELNIGTQEDQSPTLNNARNLNRNNLQAFHIITIPDNEEEQTSKYFDTEV